MRKENLKTVGKTWGEEIWLVNNKDYCGKLLILEKNATSSYHYHSKKKETFYAIEGYVKLIVNEKSYMLAPFTRPKTIEPGDKHSFHGITEAVILEISTYHSDLDVTRLIDSKEAERMVIKDAEP